MFHGLPEIALLIPRVRALPALLMVWCLMVSHAWGATYDVGVGESYATLASLPMLAPGDVVQVHSGTYPEVKRWSDAGTPANPITIRGVGPSRPVIDASGIDVSGSLPHPRAVFQIEASNIVIQHIELINARNGDNGAGVRITSFGTTTSNVTIQDCSIHDCDMGVMDDSCDQILIDRCEIAFNGTSLYAGFSHNLYLGGTRTTVQGCYIHDASEGQNVKSRSHYTALLYNWIADSQDGEIGLVDETVTGTPNSNAVVIGNVIISKVRVGSTWNHGRFIMFGEDSGNLHTGTMYVYNNTCIAADSNINFLWSDVAGASIVADNNIFVGSDQISQNDVGAVSGSSNWLPATATVPRGFTSSIQGSAPGFVNGTSGSLDLHLLLGSVCRNAGLDALNVVDGGGSSHNGVPLLQYEGLGTLISRPADTHLDLGAYGVAGAGGTTTASTTSGGTTTSGSTTGTSGSGSGTTTTGSSSGSTATGTGSTTVVPAHGSGSRGACGVSGGMAMLGSVLLVVLRRRCTPRDR